MKRVLVAMSGGVDSSVAALLLKQEGQYDIEGCYMKIWLEETDVFGECPWQNDIDDAKAVADQLDIPFRVVNLIDEYRERVVDYMISGYQSGITPNPDVMCNREIKFGAFLDYARNEGFDAVATGHYVQSKVNADGMTELWEGFDKNKDQSYFLALLNQDQAAHGLFPVGNIAKPKLREIAQKAGLVNADKKDSQGICFIGKNKNWRLLAGIYSRPPRFSSEPRRQIPWTAPGIASFYFGTNEGLRYSIQYRSQVLRCHRQKLSEK